VTGQSSWKSSSTGEFRSARFPPDDVVNPSYRSCQLQRCIPRRLQSQSSSNQEQGSPNHAQDEATHVGQRIGCASHCVFGLALSSRFRFQLADIEENRNLLRICGGNCGEVARLRVRGHCPFRPCIWLYEKFRSANAATWHQIMSQSCLPKACH
jgi:hypothetical protein